jgi:hypothetical protein
MLNPVTGLPAFNVVPLPSPLNGYRLAEQMDNYNNWLVDADGVALESFSPTDSTTPVDSTAATNATIATNAATTPANEKTFFTWQVSQNLFSDTAPITQGNIDDAQATATMLRQAADSAGPPGSSDIATSLGAAADGADAMVAALQATLNTYGNSSPNPSPVSFAKAATTGDNTPKWTYNYGPPRSDGYTKQSFLYPFMKTVTPSQVLPVHWGCTMKQSLAMNQPFEMLFTHPRQVQAIAEAATELTPRFTGLEDMLLTKKAYFAFETGKNSSYHYLFVFARGFSPRFYVLSQASGGNGLTATLTSEFTDFTGEKLFDPENGYFSVKVEPVGTSLLVTSPQFDGKQWTIWGSGASPYFIGQGQLAVYSGNVQAGFAMRPVQYQSLGVFFTPKTAFIQNTSDNTEPTVTAALKGAGDAQQYQSGDGNVYAVDAEVFNGQDITSFVTADATFLAMNAAQGPIQPSPPNGQRKILATVNRNSVQSGSVNQNYYYATVSMNASDIMQGGSYTVANGRSPYIWQLRLELDQSTNGAT